MSTRSAHMLCLSSNPIGLWSIAVFPLHGRGWSCLSYSIAFAESEPATTVKIAISNSIHFLIFSFFMFIPVCVQQ